MHIYAQIHKQTVLYLTVCLYFNSHMMLIKQTLTTKTTFHEVPKISNGIGAWQMQCWLAWLF